MGKVFQVETRNTGVLWGLTGGLLISLLLFLILPFTQKFSGSNPKNLLLKVDVSLPPPPPPPPHHRPHHPHHPRRRRKRKNRNCRRNSRC
jgi:hypothetical protein